MVTSIVRDVREPAFAATPANITTFRRPKSLLAERFYSLLALPDDALVERLAGHVRSEHELSEPARYEAVLARLQAWLELDPEDRIVFARAWERALEEAAVGGTRKVALRSAMTLSPDPGGVFDTLLGLARRGLGGRAGDGRQFMSWIHHEDFSAAVRWLIDRDDIEGAVNVAAPNPLPNAEWTSIAIQRSSWPRISAGSSMAWTCSPTARPSGCSSLAPIRW